jgi:ferredoxin
VNWLFATLVRFDAAAWARAVDALVPSIHPIDRHATRIWFGFFPLSLHLALEAARTEGPDAETLLVRTLRLMGRWRLADQVDTSHTFLYAHRYWPQVKSAIAATEPPPAVGETPEDLRALVIAVADAASRTARVDADMLRSLAAVGLMTLRQAGVDAFAAAPGHIHLSDRARARSPHQVLSARAKDDWQGPLGFLRGLKKQWTITFDENDPDARFTLINGQEMATAAQTDKRDYRSREPRCTPGEGPIPVECRAASCGTCWVGILGGADKLSPVVDRDERQRMQVFGYLDSPEPKPMLRLACQAKAFGAVSIVIPPWNGFISRRP